MTTAHIAQLDQLRAEQASILAEQFAGQSTASIAETRTALLQADPQMMLRAIANNEGCAATACAMLAYCGQMELMRRMEVQGLEGEL